MQLLLAHGANANHARSDAADALFMASQDGHVEVVQLLLAHGANRIAQAHAIATQAGHSAIVDILTPLLS